MWFSVPLRHDPAAGQEAEAVSSERSDFGTLSAGSQGRLWDGTKGHSVRRGQWWMGTKGSTGLCIGMEGT